jgi:hypothetical protein
MRKSINPNSKENNNSDLNLDAELHLIGITHLGEFLQFVRRRAIAGRERDEYQVAQLWRESAVYFETLQNTESAAIQKATILPLPKTAKKHIDQLIELGSFKSTFASVPIAFGLVPLHQLICSQFDITVSTLTKLKQSLPVKANALTLAKLCLPLEPAHGVCVLGRETGSEYIFHSDSHDLRFLGAQIVNINDIKNYHPNGYAQTAVVLGVGFSTNVLNVVRYADRLVLNNGYHRALALLALGYTHAPCVIQVCSHWEDVEMCAMSEISENATLYFTKKRPPLLRDYLDKKLTSQWPVKPVRRQLTLKITKESRDLA